MHSDLSPELALVDPSLARRVRSHGLRAPQPGVGIGVGEILPLPHLRPSRPADDGHLDDPAPVERAAMRTAPTEQAAPARRQGSGRGRRIALGVALLLTLALALGLSLGLALPREERTAAPAGESEAGAIADGIDRPATRQQPPAAIGGATSATPRPAAGGQREDAAEAPPQPSAPAVEVDRSATDPVATTTTEAAGGTPRAPTLHWPAVADAAGYNVVLWRDGARVLELWPRGTSVRIPRAWRYGDADRSLRPGAYRWSAYPAYADGNVGAAVATGSLVIEPS